MPDARKGEIASPTSSIEGETSRTDIASMVYLAAAPRLYGLLCIAALHSCQALFNRSPQNYLLGTSQGILTEGRACGLFNPRNTLACTEQAAKVDLRGAKGRFERPARIITRALNAQKCPESERACLCLRRARSSLQQLHQLLLLFLACMALRNLSSGCPKKQSATRPLTVHHPPVRTGKLGSGGQNHLEPSCCEEPTQCGNENGGTLPHIAYDSIQELARRIYTLATRTCQTRSVWSGRI